MLLDDVTQEVRTFCKARDWGQFHTPKDLAIGVATESSELLELFRFKNEEEQLELLANDARRVDIEDELADILFFVLRFADLYDIDLEDALANKLEKNRARYPKDDYRSSNQKYNE